MVGLVCNLKDAGAVLRGSGGVRVNDREKERLKDRT